MNSPASPAQQRRSQAATQQKIDALLARAKRVQKSDCARALAIAIQAQQLAETYGYPRAAVESLLLQSGWHSELTQHAEAMICVQRALRVSLEQGLEELATGCLQGIGQQFSLAGNYRRALPYFERMLALCRKRGDPSGEGAALCLIGLHRQYLGESGPAGTAYEQALALARRRKLKDLEARVHVNLGEFRLTQNDARGAVTELRSALKLYDALGDPGWAALCKANLGSACSAAGQLPAARRYLTESLSYFRACRRVRMQGIALINLSEVECLARRFPAAIKLATDVLRLARRAGDKRQEIYALEALGKAEHGAGNPAQGRMLLQQALSLAKIAEDREALQAVRASLAGLPA